MQGIRVEVEGKITPPTDPKAIQIFAFEHGDGLLNRIVQSKMKLGKFAFVGAADQMHLGPLTDWVARQLDASDQYVVVGRGSGGPVEKIVRLAKEGRVMNFVISPEGSASAGTGETRPVREKFSSGLIDRLRAEGFKVTVVPISFPENYGPPGLWADSSHSGVFRRTLRAVIHEPITPEMLEALGSTGDPGALTRLLRETWHSARVSNAEKVIGMPRMRVLEKKTHLFIAGPPGNCDLWYALMRRLLGRK